MYNKQSDLLTIIQSYRNYTDFHKFNKKIKDRFGYWNDKQIHQLPKYSEEALEDCAIKRVKELGYKNILWSGGVDSTFIICAYIKAGVPFRVICDERSVRDGTMFFYWLLDNDIPVTMFKTITEAYQLNDLMHGDVADQLFSPDEKRRINLPDNVPFFENLNDTCLQEQVYDYGKLLGKPTDTNWHIIRLINFGCFYLNGRDELYYTIFPKHRLTSFFDTPDFNDIAWTQFWERTVEDDKPEMKRFICEVTQDERMMWGVYRSPTKIPSRLPLIPENYKDWGD